MIVKIFESDGSHGKFRYRIDLVWSVEDQQYLVREYGLREGNAFERLYTQTSSLVEAYQDYRHFTKVNESVLIEYWEGGE